MRGRNGGGDDDSKYSTARKAVIDSALEILQLLDTRQSHIRAQIMGIMVQQECK